MINETMKEAILRAARNESLYIWLPEGDASYSNMPLFVTTGFDDELDAPYWATMDGVRVNLDNASELKEVMGYGKVLSLLQTFDAVNLSTVAFKESLKGRVLENGTCEAYTETFFSAVMNTSHRRSIVRDVTWQMRYIADALPASVGITTFENFGTVIRQRAGSEIRFSDIVRNLFACFRADDIFSFMR